jgi:hypothetical protein
MTRTQRFQSCSNDLYFVEGAEDVKRRSEVFGRIREKVMVETIR